MTDTTSTANTSLPATSGNKTPNVKLIGIILGVLVLAAVGVVSAKYFSSDPKKILQEALKKSVEIKSVSFNFTTSDSKVKLSGDVQKKFEELSQMQLELNNLEDKSDENLTLKAIFNKQDAYLGLTYSKMEEMIGKEMAQFTSLQTYKLLAPVLKGQKMLHFAIPQSSDKLNQPAGTSASPKAVSEKDKKQLEEIGRDLQAALVVRKYEGNAQYQGKSYQKITLGFDRDKLVAALEKLKDLDVDIKVSQVNALIKVVKAVKSWDEDLLEVYVKDGYISIVSLTMPEIPEDALKEGLTESLQDEKGAGAILKNSEQQLEKLFKPQEPGKLNKIGTLEFTNQNNAPQVSKPTSVVEFNEILDKAKVELLPLLGPLLGGLIGNPQIPGFPAGGSVPNLPKNMPKLPPNLKLPSGEVPQLPDFGTSEDQ